MVAEPGENTRNYGRQCVDPFIWNAAERDRQIGRDSVFVRVAVCVCVAVCACACALRRKAPQRFLLHSSAALVYCRLLRSDTASERGNEGARETDRDRERRRDKETGRELVGCEVLQCVWWWRLRWLPPPPLPPPALASVNMICCGGLRRL